MSGQVREKQRLENEMNKQRVAAAVSGDELEGAALESPLPVPSPAVATSSHNDNDNDDWGDGESTCS